jgi:hypothetical protein
MAYTTGDCVCAGHDQGSMACKCNLVEDACARADCVSEKTIRF